MLIAQNPAPNRECFGIGGRGVPPSIRQTSATEANGIE
jgi:hypothetical protein